MTHARPAGCEGRGAIRAGSAPSPRPRPAKVQVHRRALPAPRTPAAQGGARAAVAASQLPDPCRPEQLIGVAAGAPRCGAERPALFLEPASQAGPSVGVEPTTNGSLTVALSTELTCWWQRPRPRAVHAGAIHSAGAPGGTHEPAPLTRLPSRPRYGTAQPTRARPDGTRGRSRTCVLWVQSPTGMPATHDSCIGSGGRNRTCVGCVQSAAGMPATHT